MSKKNKETTMRLNNMLDLIMAVARHTGITPKEFVKVCYEDKFKTIEYISEVTVEMTKLMSKKLCKIKKETGRR